MKIAVVGLGVIGRVHIKSLLQLGTPPVAVCDVNEAAAKTVLQEFALDLPIYTDYFEMLSALQPDVVHICTPHYCHEEMVVSALARDVNVLCEKPLAITEAGLSRVLEAEEKSSAKLGICQQNRYNAATLFFKDFLKDKTVKSVHASVVWRRTKEYYASGAWRGKWATEGGGVMINQALHTLDLCQWIFGYPTAVTGSIATLALADAIEVEDTAMARFEGNVPFTMFATVGAGDSLPISIVAKTNVGEVTLLPHSVMVAGKTVFEEECTVVMGKSCYGVGHVPLMRDFYSVVKEGVDFAVNGKAAAAVIRLILALYKSQEERIEL